MVTRLALALSVWILVPWQASLAQEGSCCFPDGGCSLSFAEPCLVAGGFFYSDDLGCRSCGQPGACCLETECQVLTLQECLTAGGRFRGPGVSCDEFCVDVGACCLAPSSAVPCVLTFEEQCAETGGRFFGPGSVCGSCVEVVCCFDLNGTCTVTSETDCLATGGIFTINDPDLYETPCLLCCCGPTFDSTWGEVKSRYRREGGRVQSQPARVSRSLRDDPS